jgi:hypothetical protein
MNIQEEIAALNKADIAFRLAEWKIVNAATEVRQTIYCLESLKAAIRRHKLFSLLQEQHVLLARYDGEYVQMQANDTGDQPDCY